MADNNEVQDIYGTGGQVDFARRMAEALLKENNYIPDASMAKLPGSWMYGVPSMLRALAGTQYRDVAGSEDLRQRQISPGDQTTPANAYGVRANQPSKLKVSAGLGAPKPGFEGEDPTGLTGIDANKVASNQDFIHKLIDIESGGNPRARTGSYRGLGQFGPHEEARYGINDKNWTNPDVQIAALQKSVDFNTEHFKQAMGRDPTQGELYLMHQQGIAGAPALLKNPDMPAWKAIRPYYPNDSIAKQAIMGNIPKGNMLGQQGVDNIKSQDFANLWTSRFDNSSPSNVAELPGKMGLGAGAAPPNLPTNPLQQPGAVPVAAAQQPGMPGAEPSSPAGPQIAQGGPPAAKMIPPAMAPPIMENNAGYTGQVPPVNPVESQQELQRRMNAARTPDEASKIYEDYLKRKEGRTYETQGGGHLKVTPGAEGQPPIVTHIPGADINLGNIGGFNVWGRQGPNGLNVLMPNGQRGDFNSWGDLANKFSEMGGKAQGISNTETERAQHYALMEHDIMEKGNAANVNKQQLTIAKALSNDPAFYSGVGGDRVLNLQKLGSIITGNPNFSGSSEAFNKVISGANIQGLQAFKSLGQIRTPEIQLLQESNASSINTPGAVQALLEMNIRASDRISEIQDKMKQYRKDHGRIDKDFEDQMSEYYKEHPLFSDKEITNFRQFFKMEKDKHPESQWQTAPNGAQRRRAE